MNDYIHTIVMFIYMRQFQTPQCVLPHSLPSYAPHIHMFFEAEILRIVAGVLHIGNLARKSVAESHCEKKSRGFPQSLKHNKYSMFNYWG
jgi:hypothetical protein